MTGMKMALASAEDMEVAYELCGLLDGLSRGHYPAADDDENAPTWFDEDKFEHLQALFKRVEKLAESSGSIHRVVGGFSTVRGESNQVLDLTQDVVELHPRLVAALEGIERLALIRAAIAKYYEAQGDESGMHAATHSTESELIDGLIVHIGHLDSLVVSAGADAERAIDRARLAESRLESATQPLDAQMERLNQRVIALTAERDALVLKLDSRESQS
jgi:hypothetical protein